MIFAEEFATIQKQLNGLRIRSVSKIPNPQAEQLKQYILAHIPRR